MLGRQKIALSIGDERSQFVMKIVQNLFATNRFGGFWGVLGRAKVFIKRPYDEIDTKVVALINAMNSTGLIKTVASCQGHALQGRSPYVYFKTSTDIAAYIEGMLRQGWIDKSLNEYWTIQGQFDDRLELNFLLVSPAHDKRSATMFGWLTHIGSREKLDADLRYLAHLLSNIVTEAGQYREPKIQSPSYHHN